MPEPEGKKRVRVALGQAPHAAMRVLAAQSGLSMAQYAEAVLLDAVRHKRVMADAPPPNPQARPRGRPRKSS